MKETSSKQEADLQQAKQENNVDVKMCRDIMVRCGIKIGDATGNKLIDLAKHMQNRDIRLVFSNDKDHHEVYQNIFGDVSAEIVKSLRLIYGCSVYASDFTIDMSEYK